MLLNRFRRELGFWAERHPATVLTIFAVCCVFCYLPWISEHLWHLWQRQHYQFYPMFLLALGILGVTRWRQSPADFFEMQKLRVHLPLLLLSLISLAGSFWVNSPWLGFLSACSMALLIARNVMHLAPVIVPLIILLPLPFSMDVELVHSLQRISSAGASALLDSVGIHHLMSGNVLELADHQFFVAEACSGIGSIFLLLASAAIYAVWRQHCGVVTCLLLVCSVAWAVAANTFRIFVVALSHSAGGPDLDSGILHDLLGSTTYIGALLLMLFTEQFLLFVFDPVGPFEKRAGAPQKVEQLTAILSNLWNRLSEESPSAFDSRAVDRSISGLSVSRSTFFVMLSLVFAVGGVRHGWEFCRSAGGASITRAATPLELPPAFLALQKDLFAHPTNAAQLISFHDNQNSDEHDSGMEAPYCRVWKLRIAGTPVTATLSGPADGWQNLQEHYQSAGWKVLEMTAQAVPELAGNALIISEMTLYRDGGQQHVLTAAFGKTADPVAVPTDLNLATIRSGLGEHLLAGRRHKSDSLWHFQLSIRSNHSLDAAARSFWLLTFRSLFTTLLDEWRVAR